MIIRTFDLYLNAGASIAPVIHVNQYDQSESWIFTLFQEDGSRYTVSQESEAAIVGLKSDMHSILNAAEINESGQIVVTETQQMTAAAGQAIFEVLIDAGQHGTANFVVDVEPRPGDDVVPSESDLSLLQEAIEAGNRAEEAANTAEDYAGTASAAASTASAKAYEAASSASSASANATSASADADRAGTSALSAASSATSATQASSAAATSASQAVGSASAASTAAAQARQYRDEASAIVGPSLYSLMTDSQGYIALRCTEGDE